MSKRNILEQLKNASKIVDKKLKEVVDESTKKINEIDTNAALNKLKEEMARSGEKIKDAVDKTKEQALKMKDKISMPESKPQTNKPNQSAQQRQITQILKSKLTWGQKYAEQSTSQIAKRANDLKNKLQLEQKTPKSTFQSLHDKFRPWLKKNDSFYQNLFISQPKKMFAGMITNIYWRIILGICLVVMVYGLSTTALAELRKYHIQVKKLEMLNTKQNKLNEPS